jgi:molybdopterin/thiamine biosynthesis adenylyltransferase
METRLRLTAGQHRALTDALFGRVPREGAAFILAGVWAGKRGVRLTAHQCWGIPDDGFRDASSGHVELRPAALIDAVNRAAEAGCALVEAHSHPGSSVARFSSVDERGLEDVVPYMLGSLPGRVYVATVWGTEGFEGRVWRSDPGRFSPVSALEIVGSSNGPPGADPGSGAASGGAAASLRADRLDRAIGALARKRVASTRFALVGLGGLGANLLASLLSIGARRFILVDPDLLKEENVDRIPYATARDARKGVSKVALAARYVQSRIPGADIVAVDRGLESPEALRALKDADLLLGAVDTYVARLVLTRFSAAYLLPYLDSGTGVHVKDGVVRDMGGRVTVLIPGERCLVCAGRINARELSYELSDEPERELSRKRGYVTGLDVPQPMVATLNGAVANLAATEALGLLTGIKRPAEQLYYDALSGTVSEVTFADREHCRICQDLLGLAEAADVGRGFCRQEACET